MLPSQVLSLLKHHAPEFGEIEIVQTTRGYWSAGFTRLVERRGDTLRTSIGGFGATKEEALTDLWLNLTPANTFFSVAQYGRDTNYGWTGERFVVLPSVGKVGLYGVLNHLRGYIPDLPARY